MQASKHTIARSLVGAEIPSAPAALPAKGEPSSGVCLVPVARTVTTPVKCRKINAFSLDPVVRYVSHRGSHERDSGSEGNLLQTDILQGLSWHHIFCKPFSADSDALIEMGS